METSWKVPGMSQNVKTLLDKCLSVCAIDVVAVMSFEEDSNWHSVCNAMIKRKVGTRVTDNNALMYTMSYPSERHHKV